MPPRSKRARVAIKNLQSNVTLWPPSVQYHSPQSVAFLYDPIGSWMHITVACLESRQHGRVKNIVAIVYFLMTSLMPARQLACIQTNLAVGTPPIHHILHSIVQYTKSSAINELMFEHRTGAREHDRHLTGARVRVMRGST